MSAGAECFLKKCTEKSLIQYVPGDSTFMTHADAVDEVEFLKSRGSIVPIELKEGLQKLKPVSFFLFSAKFDTLCYHCGFFITPLPYERINS